MNKGTVITLATALVLAMASFSYARYVSGFKVVGVSGQQVTIQKNNEKPVMVQVEEGKYKIGDKVKYDAQKQRLKKFEKRPLEGC